MRFWLLLEASNQKGYINQLLKATLSLFLSLPPSLPPCLHPSLSLTLPPLSLSPSLLSLSPLSPSLPTLPLTNEPMPSKTICCGEKAVLVSLYVERPRKGSSKPDQHHHHHHYHRLRQRPTHHKVDGGPNRRANLLLYSQHLRETATVESAAPSPAHPASATSDNPQRINKIIPAQAKHKNSSTPTCLGDLRALIPRFLRSLAGGNGKKEKKKKKERSGSTPNKMNTVMKSFDVQKKLGFITKLLTTLRKRR